MAIKFLNAISVDSDVLYTDVVNNRVGIGTTIPSRTLDVRGSAQILASTGATGLRIVGGNVDRVYMIFGDPDDNSMGGFYYDNNTDELSIEVNNSEAVRINSNGNVGIGTTSIANAKLKVAGGGVDIESATDSLRLRFYEGATFKSGIQQVLNIGEMITASAVGDMAIRANAGNMLFATGGSTERMRIASNGVLTVGGQTSTRLVTTITENDKVDLKVIDGTDSGRAFTFSTSNSERMRITAGGDVGIGTTSPTEKLQVDGSTQLGRNGNNTAGDPHKTIISGQGIEDAGTGNFYGSYGFLELNANNNYTGSARRIAITNGLDANKFAIIRSDTNIGPMQLGVAGAVPTGAVADFVIDTSGNVGIGTTSPQAKLHVEGDVIINDPGGNAGLTMQGSAANNETYIIGQGVTGVSNGGFSIKNLAEAKDVMVFQDITGNVGIGTNSPSYQLTLGGNAVGSTQGLRINDPSNVAYGAHFSFSDTPNEVWIGGITNNTYNSAIGIHREATRVITIDVNSNVGIGTTSPRSKLNVSGPSSEGGGVLTLENSTTATGDADYVGKIQFYGNDNGTGASGIRASIDADIQGFQGETDLVFSTAPASGVNTEKMRISSSGDVGIGSPGATGRKLFVDGHIQGSESIYLGIPSGNAAALSLEIGQGRTGNGVTFIDLTGDTTYSDYGLRIIRNNTGANTSSQILHRGTGDFSISTLESANILLIPNEGNVGIGTTSPGAKLDIRGTSIASGAADVWQMSSTVTGATPWQFGYRDYNNFEIRNASNATPVMTMQYAGNVGIGTTTPASKLDVAGGVKMADDGSAASASNAGTQRYRVSGNNSYIDMCMQTGATTYAWVNIVQNNW
jgi:hypothetical protein